MAKFLNCNECHDYVAMSVKVRRCHCGETAGHYVTQRTVHVTGPCTVVGIENSVLRTGRGEAFIIHEPNRWIERR